MDPKQPSPSTSKRKFTPKPPARKPAPIKEGKKSREKEEEEAEATKLLSRFTENLRRPVPKVEKKSSVHVAFGGVGASSSLSIRKFGFPGGRSVGSLGGQAAEEHAEYEGKMDIDDSTVVEKDDSSIGFSDRSSSDKLPPKKKDYMEPWDYNTNYPITLPLREPYSGDLELLDEAEFGEAARKLENDDDVNAAKELELLEESNETKIFRIKLPEKLPFIKRQASAKGKEKVESSTKSTSKGSPNNVCSLEELPGGCMGKMLVYKSGAIKWKLGDVLYDVSPGTSCRMAEDLMAINTSEKQCSNIGEIGKHVVVTPDVESLLKSQLHMS